MKKLSEFSYLEHTGARIAVQDLLREFSRQMEYIYNAGKESEVIELVLSNWEEFDNHHPKLIKKYINEGIKEDKENLRFELLKKEWNSTEYTNPNWYLWRLNLLEEAKKQISKK